MNDKISINKSTVDEINNYLDKIKNLLAEETKINEKHKNNSKDEEDWKEQIIANIGNHIKIAVQDHFDFGETKASNTEPIRQELQKAKENPIENVRRNFTYYSHQNLCLVTEMIFKQITDWFLRKMGTFPPYVDYRDIELGDSNEFSNQSDFTVLVFKDEHSPIRKQSGEGGMRAIITPYCRPFNVLNIINTFIENGDFSSLIWSYVEVLDVFFKSAISATAEYASSCNKTLKISCTPIKIVRYQDSIAIKKDFHEPQDNFDLLKKPETLEEAKIIKGLYYLESIGIGAVFENSDDKNTI